MLHPPRGDVSAAKVPESLENEEPIAMTQLLNRCSLGVFLLTLSVSVLFIPEVYGADRPNVLWIVGDDVGYGDVGFHGCKDIPTPHLDALAANGMRFTDGYVSGPYCSPTRAALLTGRYQQRFGHEFNPGGNAEGMPTTEKTLAEHLQSVGYKTGLVGKWHLGNTPNRRPLRRGFDEFLGFLGGAHSYFEAEGILRGDRPAEAIDYATDAFDRTRSANTHRLYQRQWWPNHARRYDQRIE
jgi:arylsulfatase A-like enzyme